MVALCLPEESERIHEELYVKQKKHYFNNWEFPISWYSFFAGDLGSSLAKNMTWAWLPGQGKYRGDKYINCTDFQSRRLNIRIRRKNGEIVTAHTLNGTAVSVVLSLQFSKIFSMKMVLLIFLLFFTPFTGGLTKSFPR